MANIGFLALCYVSVGALLVFTLPNCDARKRVFAPTGPSTSKENNKLGKRVELDISDQTEMSETAYANSQNAKTAAATSVAQEARESSREFIGTDLDEESIINQLASEPPKGFVSVGHTSVVFRMSFKTQPHAAFKPATLRRPKGYSAEIAAYRLGRCLGINNVPPVVSRRISRKTLRGGLTITQTTVWPELEARIKWNQDDFVYGAAIYWVPAMRNLNLESRDEMRRWMRWLDIGGDEARAVRPLAREISNMLSFDYLIGNRDRFSGGNIKGDPQGRYLYLRDHDLAFPRRLSDRVHRRIANRMLLAKRFSRGFYHKLRKLTRERFQDELKRDSLSTKGPLLDDRQLAGLFDRREALLSHIYSLIQLYGTDRVLTFP